jgi:hypothetical protein
MRSAKHCRHCGMPTETRPRDQRPRLAPDELRRVMERMSRWVGNDTYSSPTQRLSNVNPATPRNP